MTNTVINTANTSVIITGLTPGQYYNINITAVNIIGLGPVLMINGDLYNIVKIRLIFSCNTMQKQWHVLISSSIHVFTFIGLIIYFNYFL